MNELTIEKVSAELDVLFSKAGKSMETIDRYIHQKRIENAHIYNLIQLLIRHFNDAGDEDLANELGLHGFCGCKVTRLSNVIRKMYGEEIFAKIFDGVEYPAESWTDWTQTERKDFALFIQKKILSVISEDDYRRAMEGVSRTWVSDDGSVGTTKKDVTLSDLDAFIKESNENHVNYHGTDNTALEAFDSEEWKIRREGSKVTVVQIPFLKNKYLSQTDEKMKRYYACRCPWVRASILKGETVASSFCHCSLGYQKQGFETFFGRHLDGRVVKSVVDEGVLQCVFEIDIPNDIMEGSYD